MTFTELKEALYLFGFHENDLLSIKRIKQGVTAENGF